MSKLNEFISELSRIKYELRVMHISMAEHYIGEAIEEIEIELYHGQK